MGKAGRVRREKKKGGGRPDTEKYYHLPLAAAWEGKNFDVKWKGGGREGQCCIVILVADREEEKGNSRPSKKGERRKKKKKKQNILSCRFIYRRC